MQIQNETTLWYTSPADAWYQGMPIGNGRMGAMVRGGTDRELLSVNEETMWSGRPFVSPRTESHKVFAQIRELVLRGEMQQAAELAALEFSDKVAQIYLPLGDIVLDFAAGGEIENYVRKLDLETGIVTVTYTRGGVTYTRELFASNPDEVMACRITADRPGAVTCDVSFPGKLQCTQGAEGDILTLSGNCPNYPFPRGRETKPPEDYEYGRTDAEKGVGYFAMVKALPEGGSLTEENGVLHIAGADSLTLLFSVRTSFAGWDKHPVLEGVAYEAPCRSDLAAAEALGYDVLKKRHIADVTPLFQRMTLELPADENAALPTDERLIRHGAGERDRGLYALLFHFGRYLTIAASRPGTQVTNLQGIWNDLVMPPWGSNCTININTEMNYWPTLRCGLTECYKPLIDFVKEMAKSGEVTARDYYDAPGFVSHSATDLWRMCHPQNNGIPGSAQWGFWDGSSGWLARMLWDYYAFTGDRGYLAEVYPVLLSAASFYRHLLVERNGELLVVPGTSPENNYLLDGEACPVDVTTEMVMAICRDIFRCVIDAAKVLEKPEGAEYARLLPRLRPMTVASDGRINEWYGEHPDWDVHHRHISHLYGLFPGREYETMDDTQRAAAAKVLNVREDASTGWSVAWKLNCWARLKDGDRAEKLLDTQLMPVAGTEEISMAGDGGTFLSLLCAHPPFQIDGNYGAASGVMEMLLWNEGDKVELLPALPTDWDHGSVTGLMLHGGGKLSFAWENGRVLWCRITGGYETYTVTSAGERVEYLRCMVLQHGRPGDAREERETRVYDLLDSLNVSYTRIDHEPAWTMKDCEGAEDILGAPTVKNLFLTNRQKTKFYLLIMAAEKPFLTKELSAQIGSARLSFAGEKELLELLDVYPGSASVLALMNDKAGAVQLLLEKDVLAMEAIACHPCKNTTRVRLEIKTLLETILPAMNHDYLTVELKGE